MTNHILYIITKYILQVYSYYIIQGYIIFTKGLFLPGTISRDGWILLLSPFYT